MENEAVCKNCWWLSDEYTSVCTNENSPNCADFVLHSQTCAWFDANDTPRQNVGFRYHGRTITEETDGE